LVKTLGFLWTLNEHFALTLRFFTLLFIFIFFIIVVWFFIFTLCSIFFTFSPILSLQFLFLFHCLLRTGNWTSNTLVISIECLIYSSIIHDWVIRGILLFAFLLRFMLMIWFSIILIVTIIVRVWRWGLTTCFNIRLPLWIRKVKVFDFLFICDFFNPSLKITDNVLIFQSTDHCYFPNDSLILLLIFVIKLHFLDCIYVSIKFMSCFEYSSCSTFPYLLKLLKV
jgi:hypothetical protein